MSWHLDNETIDAYRANALSPAMAASLEAHVLACAACRRLVSGRSDARRAASNWSAITDRIDEPRRNVVERLLTLLGLRAHIARLVVLTPTFRVAWLGALGVVSAIAIAAGSDRTVLRGDRGSFAFLVLAPLLPVIGTAAAFSPRTDPAYELTASTPLSAFELLLIRATAVVMSSAAVTAAVSFALPGDPTTASAWLLPGLGLTTTTLALARWMPLTTAAGALSALWLGAATVTARSDAATRLIAEYPPFRPAGQMAFLLLALAATATAVATRHSFDLRRTT